MGTEAAADMGVEGMTTEVVAVDMGVDMGVAAMTTAEGPLVMTMAGVAGTNLQHHLLSESSPLFYSIQMHTYCLVMSPSMEDLGQLLR